MMCHVFWCLRRLRAHVILLNQGLASGPANDLEQMGFQASQCSLSPLMTALVCSLCLINCYGEDSPFVYAQQSGLFKIPEPALDALTQSNNNFHVHSKQISRTVCKERISMTESTGWSWLLSISKRMSNSTDSTRYQDSTWGLWFLFLYFISEECWLDIHEGKSFHLLIP